VTVLNSIKNIKSIFVLLVLAILVNSASCGLVLADEVQSKDTIGLHLATAHEKPNFNNENPGIYYRNSSGLTLGSYFNSERNQSNYAGYTVHGSNFGVSFVVLSGYKVGLLLVPIPSVRFEVARDVSVRFTGLYSPHVGAAVHLSVEFAVNK
jgi:hypothetical protein